MKAGVNRLAGRNNNRLDLNPDGSIEMSSVNSTIIINSPTVTPPPSFTPPTNLIIPNPTQSVATTLEAATDVIPLFFPTGSPTGSSATSSKVTQSFSDEEQFLPEEEYLFFVPSYTDIVYPTDESVINVDPTINAAEYYGSIGAASSVANIKYDGTKIAVNNRSLYIDGVGYQKQPNGWTCLVTSTVLIFDWERKYGTNKTYGLNFNDFPNLTNNGGGGKYLNGKIFQSSVVTQNYPNFTQAVRSTVDDPFNSYKNFFKQVNKPIIIRIAGTGARSRGHFVVMIGITNDGNIIVHDPASTKTSSKDQIITKERLLRKGEADNNINYQILYIK